MNIFTLRRSTPGPLFGSRNNGKLEIEPGKAYVRRILRLKYLFAGEESTPVIASLPTLALAGSNAREELRRCYYVLADEAPFSTP